MRSKFLISLIIFFLSHSLANAQDENVFYNDTLTQKLFQIKKDYSKRIFESTYYTIQIYFGDLKNADSILIDFQENHEGIKSELIFETPNYKVRIGEYKDIDVASQKLEGIRRTYPGSFIIKLSEL
ncbi:SPOR domain-containing protein [Flavobacteriaceae bacterium]|nr:SPOR domain-containing protein [Flavobacteriaceae bacterium]MDC3297552.1 SPOR domain-containing protein [Flavobacteriaceae bacterium]